MKAEAKGFKFLTMEGKVKIPFFQRTYVWDEDNWEELIIELLSDKTSSFLGSIILKQLPTISGEPKQLEVIDGQQRLTTLSILLKALYDTFSEEVKKNCEGDIMGILRFRRDYATSSSEIRIEHSQVDSEAYRKVIDGSKNISLESKNKNNHKILRCYQYFIKELKQIDDNKKGNILNKILNPDNKMLVIIDLAEKDDEQIIFDTLNTAGVRLTTAEIIKNALFQKVISVLGKKESAIKLYKSTWETTFLADEDTVRYWETERLTGRLKRDNIEILLHCIAVIKEFFDPDKHTLSDLSKLYKEEIAGKNSKEELEPFINGIIDYAQIYREKILAFDKTTLFSFSNPIKRLLHILEVLEISTFHPYILHVFKEHTNDEEQIKSILFNLEKFVIKTMFSPKEKKNYNKLCKSFIDDHKRLGEKLNEINWDNFSNGLRSISNKHASLLLFWVELYRRSNRRHDITELQYNYSLEHIMPQKWEEHWSDIPDKQKPDGSPMTPEEKKQDRNDKIFWIGNMTLLTSNLNASLKNLKFEKKMEGEGLKKGIKAYADLSITKDDIVEPFKKDRVWNEDKIKERTEKLKEEILKIWGSK